MVEVAQAQGVKCPICGWSGPQFEPMGRRRRPNAQCPSCHSLERHRAMFLYLRDETDVLTRPTRLLHFAPEPAMRRVFEERQNIEYVTTDLEMPDVSMRMDIHGLLFRDEVFDFVVCSHVLEHVEDDRAAMREIRRVLRPGGVALILVPVLPTPDGRTFEDQSITTPDARERAYGQADHVRAYGEDFPDRVRDAGLDVEAFRPAERWSGAATYALDDREVLFIARPAADGAAPDPPAEPLASDTAPPRAEPGGPAPTLWFETQISPDDAMARPDRLDHYFRVGLEALRLVEGAVASAGVPPPESILDLPCGYGRVLRMLRAGFPNAAITACDLDRGAVEFCESVLGAKGAISEPQLDALALPRSYDLVWCGSLLTHLPEEDTRGALRALVRHLAPGGLLVFTTHGDRIHEWLARGGSPANIEDSAKSQLLRRYEDEGFGFAPYANSADGSYGFALSSRGWVEAALTELPDVTHRSSLEAGWDGRQDVYVCQRTRA